MEDRDTESEDARPRLAEVTLSIDGGEPQPKAVPAGRTQVGELKLELGVDPKAVLWLIEGDHTRKQLDPERFIDVHTGQHFEAIGGGGVS